MKRYTVRMDKVAKEIRVRTDLASTDEKIGHYFNYNRMSTAALIATWRNIVGEIDLPDWARQELDMSIPSDANKAELLEAIEAAREDETSDRPVEPEAIQSMINRYLRDSGFSSLKEAQEHFMAILPLSADPEGLSLQ